jgi:hypothetical protein
MLGLVAATKDSAFFIFSSNKGPKGVQFQLTTKWIPQIPQWPVNQVMTDQLYQF